MRVLWRGVIVGLMYLMIAVSEVVGVSVAQFGQVIFWVYSWPFEPLLIATG